MPEPARAREGRRPARIPPRLMRRTDAADYAGLSPSKFDELVKAGRLPKPFKVDGCVLWDVRDLDPAIDELKDMAGGAADAEWGDVAA